MRVTELSAERAVALFALVQLRVRALPPSSLPALLCGWRAAGAQCVCARVRVHSSVAAAHVHTQRAAEEVLTVVADWKKKKKDSTEASHVVPHRSTSSAQGCLTSAIGRELV